MIETLESRTLCSFTLAAAGDLADSGSKDSKVAALVHSLHPDAFAAVGDLDYSRSDLKYFRELYSDLGSKLIPIIGNHDSASEFKKRLHSETEYLISLGDAWTGVIIDSNHPNAAKLRATLSKLGKEANVVLFDHHPRWSSGEHGSSSRMDAVWKVARDWDVDLAIWGHDHDVEGGIKDEIPWFVVGTGGRGLRSKGRSKAPGSLFFNSSSLGVGVFTLESDGSFGFEFKPATGSFTFNRSFPNGN